MHVENTAAKFFRMTDAVWERHANPWSAWTRYPCLPMLALAVRAVLGERVYLAHREADLPEHHKRAIRVLNFIAFAGVVLAIYRLVTINVTLAVIGTLITMIGKSWFLDRMVWLYQDLGADNETYRRWLY